MTSETELTQIASEAFDQIMQHDGTQSQRHKIVLRSWLVDKLKKNLDPRFQISKIEGVSKNNEISGLIFGRKMDVSIKLEGEVVGIVRMKFIHSSHGKNFKNNLSNEIGEIANFKSKEIIFGNLIFSTHPIKSVKENVESWDEQFDSQDIDHHYKLLNSGHELIKMDAQGICIFNLNEDYDDIVGLCDRSDLSHLSGGDHDMLDEMTFDNFLQEFCNKINAI